MTLHWLVKPKDPAAFHPSFIKFLEEGVHSGTSKKDTEIRVSELREAILPVLKEDMASDAEFWLNSKAAMLLALAVLSIESSKNIVEAFAKAICRPDWKIKVNNEEVLAVEDAGIHMCLKKLALMDKSAEYSLGELKNGWQQTVAVSLFLN
ncbi:unnamed protein product [Leptidea sinapis]|nr:unnamed protein product [Leptidea sinapis]